MLKDIDKFKYKDVIKINDKISSKLPLQKTMTGIKIGSWEYWNVEGIKVAEIESKVQGEKIVDKVTYVSRSL